MPNKPIFPIIKDEERRERLRKIMRIGLIAVAAILLIAGGAFAIYKFANKKANAEELGLKGIPHHFFHLNGKVVAGFYCKTETCKEYTDIKVCNSMGECKIISPEEFMDKLYWVFSLRGEQH